LQGCTCIVVAWQDAPQCRACVPHSGTHAPERHRASCALKPTTCFSLLFAGPQCSGVCVRRWEKTLHLLSSPEPTQALGRSRRRRRKAHQRGSAPCTWELSSGGVYPPGNRSEPRSWATCGDLAQRGPAKAQRSCWVMGSNSGWFSGLWTTGPTGPSPLGHFWPSGTFGPLPAT
jgi:hypothetical protein